MHPHGYTSVQRHTSTTQHCTHTHRADLTQQYLWQLLSGNTLQVFPAGARDCLTVMWHLDSCSLSIFCLSRKKTAVRSVAGTIKIMERPPTCGLSDAENKLNILGPQQHQWVSERWCAQIVMFVYLRGQSKQGYLYLHLAIVSGMRWPKTRRLMYNTDFHTHWDS